MKNFISLSLCALSLLVGSAAFAEHVSGHGACSEDMKKLCGAVKNGDHDAMMKCMRSHDDKLSAPCKDEHAKMMGKMQELKTACQADMDSFCKDVKKDDHHAMHDCMMKNQDKMSDTCKAAHAKMKKDWEEHKAKAKSDAAYK